MKSLNHPFLAASPDITAICQPLKSLSICYFSYTKAYNDGSRIYLTNFPKRLEHYLIKKEYLSGNLERQPKYYQKQLILWSTLPNQQVFTITRNMGIDHGMFMIEPSSHYNEYYGFASYSNNYSIINSYLNHIDVLKKFTQYFKEKATSVINLAETHKLILPYHNINLNLNVNQTIANDLNFKISSNDRKLNLTHRQLQCANLLLSGKSTRAIGEILGLSPRTIETHINNLKIKFNSVNKTELILKLAKIINL